MNFHSLSKRQWVLLSVSVVIVGAALWAFQAGYLPEIGKFFAAEPGYVPSCAWYGEPLSPTQQCCSGFVPVPVTYAVPSPIPSYILNAGDVVGQPVFSSLPPRTISPTPTRTPPPPSYTPTPTPMPAQYCVLPGCQVVQRQVYCIKAPCPPIVDIVCPSGITPPPPRPTPSPTVTATPINGINVYNPPAGGAWYVPATHEISWTVPAGYRFPASSAVNLTLINPTNNPGEIYEIAKSTLGLGRYLWDTSRPVTRMSDGKEQDLLGITGSGFYIIVQIIGEQESGRSGSFILTNRPLPSTSITPTPPVFQGVSIGYGSAVLQTIQIPLSSDAHGIGLQMRPYPQSPLIGGAAITAVSMRVRYNPQYLKPYGVSSQYFPDVLQPIQVEPVRPDMSYFTFTLGSGTHPAQVSFATSPITLEMTPLKAGAAGGVGLYDVVITTPGNSANASKIDPTNFPNIMVEITDTTPVVPGDANGDGKVDIFDYNLVVSNFGKTGTNVPGDVNKDGKVDIFDYNLVISNFGK